MYEDTNEFNAYQVFRSEIGKQNVFLAPKQIDITKFESRLCKMFKFAAGLVMGSARLDQVTVMTESQLESDAKQPLEKHKMS